MIQKDEAVDFWFSNNEDSRKDLLIYWLFNGILFFIDIEALQVARETTKEKHEQNTPIVQPSKNLMDTDSATKSNENKGQRIFVSLILQNE